MPLDAPVTTAPLPASRPPFKMNATGRDPPFSGRAPVVLRLAGLPGPEVSEELQLLYHPLGALSGRLLVGLENQVWGVGRFVGVGDTGELFDLARESLLVEALHVPIRAHLQRGVDEDLDEVHDPAPYLVPRLLVGRDGTDDHTNPVAREQVGDEPYPQDVYITVVPGEAEALGEVGPYDIPVEYLHGPFPVPELALDYLGDRGLARAREPGEPQGKSAFFVHARSFRHSDCLYKRSLHIPLRTAHTTIVGSAGESPPGSFSSAPSGAGTSPSRSGSLVSTIHASRFPRKSFSVAAWAGLPARL